jgi:hypothetical protein
MRQNSVCIVEQRSIKQMPNQTLSKTWIISVKKYKKSGKESKNHLNKQEKTLKPGMIGPLASSAHCFQQ